MSAKNNRSKPVMIAPITLAGAMSITKSITDARTVPSIPVKNNGPAKHMHLIVLAQDIIDNTSKSPRLAIATPNSAHKNGVDTVKMPENVKNPAIIPITMLARTAMPVQFTLQLQLFIQSPPINLMQIKRKMLLCIDIPNIGSDFVFINIILTN